MCGPQMWQLREILLPSQSQFLIHLRPPTLKMHPSAFPPTQMDETT